MQQNCHLQRVVFHQNTVCRWPMGVGGTLFAEILVWGIYITKTLH